MGSTEERSLDSKKPIIKKAAHSINCKHSLDLSARVLFFHRHAHYLLTFRHQTKQKDPRVDREAVYKDVHLLNVNKQEIARCYVANKNRSLCCGSNGKSSPGTPVSMSKKMLLKPVWLLLCILWTHGPSDLKIIPMDGSLHFSFVLYQGPRETIHNASQPCCFRLSLKL
jgi:hypothetical protein